MKGALNPLIVKMTFLFLALLFYNDLSPLPYQIMKGFSKWFLVKSVDVPGSLRKRDHLATT